MNIVIGSARVDERGTYSGGAKGDQKQGSAVPDYRGEVSMQAFYVHSKGWYVIRPKDANVARKIANAMRQACNNPNIGYSQSDRYGVIKYGTATTTKTNADCSSLVRQCIKEAAGVDLGDFTTANEASVLEASGLFKPRIVYSASTALYTGDVLVTQTKGHTVVVTEGIQRSVPAGWVKEGIRWRYYESGAPVQGDWRLIGTTTGRHWYYFGKDGYMLTGWQEIDGKIYYLDEDFGAWSEGACWISDAAGAQHRHQTGRGGARGRTL